MIVASDLSLPCAGEGGGISKEARDLAGSSPLRDEIIESASSAQTVNVDGTTTTARSLKELIEADRYIADQNAAASRRLPVRVHKIKPGGAA